MKEEVGKKIGMSNWRCSFFHQPLNELPNVKSGEGKKEEEEEIESLFKMLKLAEFNSMKYSFNKKTRVPDRASFQAVEYLLFICYNLNLVEQL